MSKSTGKKLSTALESPAVKLGIDEIKQEVIVGYEKNAIDVINGTVRQPRSVVVNTISNLIDVKEAKNESTQNLRGLAKVERSLRKERGEW